MSCCSVSGLETKSLRDSASAKKTGVLRVTIFWRLLELRSVRDNWRPWMRRNQKTFISSKYPVHAGQRYHPDGPDHHDGDRGYAHRRDDTGRKCRFRHMPRAAHLFPGQLFCRFPFLWGADHLCRGNGSLPESGSRPELRCRTDGQHWQRHPDVPFRSFMGGRVSQSLSSRHTGVCICLGLSCLDEIRGPVAAAQCAAGRHAVRRRG